jgi:class 3 adenylate cyclase
LPCPACGFENEPTAKFCGGCGKPTGETTAPAPAVLPAPPPRTDTAERRQLTVMFCDLVGSTALSSRLDPEDLREIIAAYHRAAAGVVAQFDGFIANYMGDGVLVYFGYPQAHEDDADALVQDAANSTLLRGPRRKLHAQIAEALETHSPELMDSQPEVFATMIVLGNNRPVI